MFSAFPRRHCLSIQSRAHRIYHHHHHHHRHRNHHHHHLSSLKASLPMYTREVGSQVCRRRGHYVTLHFPPIYCFIGGIFYITFSSVLPPLNWSNLFLIFFFSSSTFLFLSSFYLSPLLFVWLYFFFASPNVELSICLFLTFCISYLNCEYKQIVSIERGGVDLFPTRCT